MSFFSTLREVMRLPDLRRRILITLAILVIYRFAANVPVPGVDQEALAGSSVRFLAIGRDEHGNMVQVDPAWEINGPANVGNVSSNGVFIADRVGQIEVRARAGGIIGAAFIKVRASMPAFIVVEPDPLSISSRAADAKQFSFRLFDLRGNAVETVTNMELLWTATEGIGSIDPQTGLFLNQTGLDEPRIGYVTATAVIDAGSEWERTIWDRATVILKPSTKPLASITITPNPIVVIKGDTQRFMAILRH